MHIEFQYTIEDCNRAIEWLKSHNIPYSGREPSGYELVQYANLNFLLINQNYI